MQISVGTGKVSSATLVCVYISVCIYLSVCISVYMVVVRFTYVVTYRKKVRDGGRIRVGCGILDHFTTHTHSDKHRLTSR